MEQLQKIYSSGDQTLIRAINANLGAFSRTVDLADRVRELTGRMAGMEAAIQRLEAMIEKLATQQDCCITAPPDDDGADPHNPSG